MRPSNALRTPRRPASPVQPAPDAELTSVSAGQHWCGAPRRNRTGDPILTMEPPGTAVRNTVFAGHARPSRPKLSVLLRSSYALSSKPCADRSEQAIIRRFDDRSGDPALVSFGGVQDLVEK